MDKDVCIENCVFLIKSFCRLYAVRLNTKENKHIKCFDCAVDEQLWAITKTREDINGTV